MTEVKVNLGEVPNDIGKTVDIWDFVSYVWGTKSIKADIQNYYCSEATGEHVSYYNNPGHETHGMLAIRQGHIT